MRVREGDRVRLAHASGADVTVTVQSVGDGYIRSYTSDFYYCKGWYVAEIVRTFAGVVKDLDIPDRSAVLSENDIQD